MSWKRRRIDSLDQRVNPVMVLPLFLSGIQLFRTLLDRNMFPRDNSSLYENQDSNSLSKTFTEQSVFNYYSFGQYNKHNRLAKFGPF